MLKRLGVSVGQYSDKGRKSLNQDFYGAFTPKEPLLSTKGITFAIADGISSSNVSQIASETSVKSLLADYYCTSETWSVKKSVLQVLAACNSWLNSQSQKGEDRFDRNKGFVCTLSAMVIKSTTAHLFHVGDSRIYRIRDKHVEQLTDDHRGWISSEQSYLSRAMGIHAKIEIDYSALAIQANDIFVFVTDGVYEHVSKEMMLSFATGKNTAESEQSTVNLDEAAKGMVEYAFANGSTDNLSAQIVRVDTLPSQDISERVQQLNALPFAPVLDAPTEFDGFKIIRNLYSTARSHVYLAQPLQGKANANKAISGVIPVVLKAPSIDMQDDPAHLERFLMEEWIAKRINSAHVLKPCTQAHQRNYLYTTFEFIEGQTLSQWMIDNPKPSIQSVRDIVMQIAKGLQAFHRLEMIHQDIRPENIMIDQSGVVKIIDFGSTKVAGLMEMSQVIKHENMLGTAQYSAPEYLLGELGTANSDLFSLGVVAYQMLTGKLPYGDKAARARTKSAQNNLRYQSAMHDEREVSAWVDETLQKAVHPNPYKRYRELSEFMYDLAHPSKAFLNKTKPPLIERNPVLFWQSVSAVLLVVVLYLLSKTV